MKNINNYVNEKLIINKDTEVLRNNDNELRYDDVLEQINKSIKASNIERVERIVSFAFTKEINDIAQRKFIYLDPSEEPPQKAKWKQKILLKWGSELIGDHSKFHEFGNMRKLFYDHILKLAIYIFDDRNLLDPESKKTQYIFFIDEKHEEFFIYEVI